MEMGPPGRACRVAALYCGARNPAFWCLRPGPRRQRPPEEPSRYLPVSLSPSALTLHAPGVLPGAVRALVAFVLRTEEHAVHLSAAVKDAGAVDVLLSKPCGSTRLCFRLPLPYGQGRVANRHYFFRTTPFFVGLSPAPLSVSSPELLRFHRSWAIVTLGRPVL